MQDLTVYNYNVIHHSSVPFPLNYLPFIKLDLQPTLPINWFLSARKHSSFKSRRNGWHDMFQKLCIIIIVHIVIPRGTLPYHFSLLIINKCQTRNHMPIPMSKYLDL